MKWVLCQTSSVLGGVKENCRKVQSLVRQYQDCDLLIFPELFLMGYPPEDTLECQFFIKKQEQFLQKIKLKKNDPAVLVGACILEKNILYNSAVYIKGAVRKRIDKTHLAVTDTFDEMRFFSSGKPEKHILKIGSKKCLVLICEDLWKFHFSNNFTTQKNKIDFIICINASPFFPQQLKTRMKIAENVCKKLKAPFIYLNKTGGQDEWVFDGSSFALNSKGEMVFQAPSFKEDITVIDTENLRKIKRKKQPHSLELKRTALLLGLSHFVQNNGFQKVHLGLSGGLDSALTVSLCVSALGPKNVTAFYLEGPFSHKKSRTLSKNLAQELKITWKEISIVSTYRHILSLFKNLPNIAQENIQARLRLLFLMAYSNAQPSLLIGTSNKSELSVGYGTLYGDIAGGLFPIGDLYKTEVMEMSQMLYPSKTMNEILKRKPSAELSAGQTDEKDLPPYDQLDPILKKIIEDHSQPKALLEKEIFSLILKSEFKRRQSPLILKVSSKSFGRGRRWPTTLKS